ncbi:unnamed protein product, partial [Rotaria sordida]
PRRKCRSTTARIRRNRKRNMVKRSYRDRHIIYRNVYHRFTLKQIKNILRDRDVRYVHPKLDKSSRILSIGMKKRKQQQKKRKKIEKEDVYIMSGQIYNNNKIT